MQYVVTVESITNKFCDHAKCVYYQLAREPGGEPWQVRTQITTLEFKPVTRYQT
jgi:hypothetical protein